MERYYITGAQLGLLKVALTDRMGVSNALKTLEEIFDKQFIGRMPSYDYDKYEIVIKEKGGKI